MKEWHHRHRFRVILLVVIGQAMGDIHILTQEGLFSMKSVTILSYNRTNGYYMSKSFSTGQSFNSSYCKYGKYYKTSPNRCYISRW